MDRPRGVEANPDEDDLLSLEFLGPELGSTGAWAGDGYCARSSVIHRQCRSTSQSSPVGSRIKPIAFCALPRVAAWLNAAVAAQRQDTCGA
jgi:hypothetical protein